MGSYDDPGSPDLSDADAISPYDNVDSYHLPVILIRWQFDGVERQIWPFTVDDKTGCQS